MLPASKPSVLRPTRVRFFVLLFACGLSLITYLDRVCISQVQENIKTDLRLDDFQLGLVFSSFVLGYALFEVPGGYLGDVWGARKVLTVIVLWWSAWTALTGCVWLFRLDSGWWVGPIPLLFDSLILMLLIRFIFGAGEAGAYPNLTRVVSAWFPYRERGLCQGSIWMSARLGGALAPVVIAALAGLLGWRPAFWVLGLVGVSWTAGFFFWFRDRPEQKPECNEAERDLIRRGNPYAEAEAHGRGHAWPPLRPMLASATLWALCLAAFCVNVGWWFYPTWLPKYLKEVHGASGMKSALQASLPFLCGAAGAFLGGGLSDWLVRRWGWRRWGRSLVGAVGFAGAGACVLATGFAASETLAVALLSLAFFINDLAIPPIWAASADVGGRYAGTVAGVMNMVGGVGAFLSPILTPVVLAALPGEWSAAERWRWIFAGLAAAWFLGAVAWLFVDAAKPLFREESGTRGQKPGETG